MVVQQELDPYFEIQPSRCPSACSFVVFPHLCPATSGVVTKGIVLAPSAREWAVSEPASALGAQAELPAPARKGEGAGMGGGFYFGDEVKQDTAALPRDLAAAARG